jgi:hypothetical protein
VVVCDGCPRVVHLSCLPSNRAPPTSALSSDPWLCERCHERKARRDKQAQDSRRRLHLNDERVRKRRQAAQERKELRERQKIQRLESIRLRRLQVTRAILLFVCDLIMLIQFILIRLV